MDGMDLMDLMDGMGLLWTRGGGVAGVAGVEGFSFLPGAGLGRRGRRCGGGSHVAQVPWLGFVARLFRVFLGVGVAPSEALGVG